MEQTKPKRKFTQLLASMVMLSILFSTQFDGLQVQNSCAMACCQDGGLTSINMDSSILDFEFIGDYAPFRFYACQTCNYLYCPEWSPSGTCGIGYPYDCEGEYENCKVSRCQDDQCPCPVYCREASSYPCSGLENCRTSGCQGTDCDTIGTCASVCKQKACYKVDCDCAGTYCHTIGACDGNWCEEAGAEQPCTGRDASDCNCEDDCNCGRLCKSYSCSDESCDCGGEGCGIGEPNCDGNKCKNYPCPNGICNDK